MSGAEPGGQWLDSSDLAACAPSGVDVEQVAAAAAEMMFALSGHQFGEVIETVRPFQVSDTCGCAGHADIPGYSFSWTSHSAWSRAAACACGGPSYLRLLGPVSDVAEVLVDGEPLVEGDDWTLYDGIWLVRVGGTWPCCQDLTKPSSEPGTWAITYTHGNPVPAAGQLAAQMFACDLAKAAAGEDCALTGRVQSVTRDGVSAQVVIFDGAAMLAEGRTGIQVVDLWIASLGVLRGGTIGRPGHPMAGLRVPTLPA